jgi:hypothetical protein
MAKKSSRKRRAPKNPFPAPVVPIETAPFPAPPAAKGNGFVSFARWALILVILWFLGKSIWQLMPGSEVTAQAPAQASAKAPVSDQPPVTNNDFISPSKADGRRMNITIEFDGVKTKWGYSAWATDGSANPNVNKAIQGSPLDIRDTKYKQGIGTHAPSEIAFDLGGEVKKFSCLVGPDAAGGTADIIVFSVIGDGKKLYESPVLRGGETSGEKVDVNVSGVKELKLKVVTGGKEAGWGHADWVNLKFVKE